MLSTAALILTMLPQAPVKETLTGATHVTRVDAALMCGGATSPDAFPELKKQGFASIINLRQANETGVDVPASQAAAQSAGLKYVHIPVNPSSPDPAAVDTFVRAVTDPANQPMYIHCGTANRVGALWLVKRVVVDGWDVERAVSEAEAIGLTSPALKKFAIDYAAKHRKQ
jgi:uncharacterized protein (TIGR01244 family)